MAKVSFSQRVEQKDYEYIHSVLDAYMTAKGIGNKGDALVHFIRNRAYLTETTESVVPEIIYPQDIVIEELCPFGFLKKISNKYGRDLWHCLKQQGPDSRGEPVLLADGKDESSIRSICQTCQINWQRKPQKLDQFKLVFEKLGNQQISSILYLCIRNIVNDAIIDFSTTEHGSFYCSERRGKPKVTIKNTCKPSNCPFLIIKTITLDVAETLPYIEAQKALEDLK